MYELQKDQSTLNFLKYLEILPILGSDPTLKEFAEMQAVAALNNCDSGKTISEVMENIRRQPYEVIVVFDKDGNKLCDRTIYDKWMGELCLPDSVRRLATTAIHNHIDDFTFSALDLQFVEQLDIKTNILVTPDRNYYLERPKHGWPKGGNWSDELAGIEKSLYYTSKFNPDRATARHQALTRVTERYEIPYYSTNLSGEAIARNSF